MPANLTSEQVTQAAELGVSAEHMQFIIDTQIQSLFTEALQRVRHMPFEIYNAAIEVGCSNFEVVRYLGDFAHFEYIQTERSDDFYETLISGETASKGSEPIIVRNKPWPRIDMPMYLDHGNKGLQYVYPIFDWSEAQILAFMFSRGLTKELS